MDVKQFSCCTVTDIDTGIAMTNAHESTMAKKITNRVGTRTLG